MASRDHSIECDAPAREAERLARDAAEQLSRAFERVTWQWVLASNLVWGAMLCRSHYTGMRFSAHIDIDAIDWWPGCGKEAP